MWVLRKERTWIKYHIKSCDAPLNIESKTDDYIWWVNIKVGLTMLTNIPFQVYTTAVTIASIDDNNNNHDTTTTIIMTTASKYIIIVPLKKTFIFFWKIMTATNDIEREKVLKEPVTKKTRPKKERQRHNRHLAAVLHE